MAMSNVVPELYPVLYLAVEGSDKVEVHKIFGPCNCRICKDEGEYQGNLILV